MMTINESPLMRITSIHFPTDRPEITAIGFVPSGDPDYAPDDTMYIDLICPGFPLRLVLQGSGHYATEDTYYRFYGGSYFGAVDDLLYLYDSPTTERDDAALLLKPSNTRRITGLNFGATSGSVYISDGPDFATATLAAQSISSWSDTQIDISVVTTGISAGTRVYLWVVNSEGQRNKNGYGFGLPESESPYVFADSVADAIGTYKVYFHFLHTGSGTLPICGGGTFALNGKKETGIGWLSGSYSTSGLFSFSG